MKKGVITCVVGTFNPNMFSIPFISISEVFGTRKENLPKLLSMEREAKARIDYDAMFEYLGEQFKGVLLEESLREKIYRVNFLKLLGEPKPIDISYMVDTAKRLGDKNKHESLFAKEDIDFILKSLDFNI